jgi:hypothetical protein
MDPLISDSDNFDEEDNFSIKCQKENHIFHCDTRKMLSWFGREEAIRNLYIELGDKKEIFAKIITRCFISDNVKIQADYQNKVLFFQTSILGFSSCFADVFYGEELIAQKQEILSNGFKLNIPFKSGKYKIVFYELDDDDEDGFDFIDYVKFDTRYVNFVDEYDLVGKTVCIHSAMENTTNTIFESKKYFLSNILNVSIFARDEDDVFSFIGKVEINGETIQALIKIKSGQFNNSKIKKAWKICVFLNRRERKITDFRDLSGRLLPGASISAKPRIFAPGKMRGFVSFVWRSGCAWRIAQFLFFCRRINFYRKKIALSLYFYHHTV